MNLTLLSIFDKYKLNIINNDLYWIFTFTTESELEHETRRIFMKASIINYTFLRVYRVLYKNQMISNNESQRWQKIRLIFLYS